LSAALKGFEGYVNSVAFREDGVVLAGVDHTGIVKLWTREAGGEGGGGGVTLCGGGEEGEGDSADVDGTWRGLRSLESPPKGTLWSCHFSSHRLASLLVVGGFSGEPLATDTAEHAAVRRGPACGQAGADWAALVRAGVVAVAALWKGDGNELFKDKQYAEAMLVYSATLALLEAAAPAPAAPEEGASVNGERASAKEEEEAAELKVTCHCNIAACALNAGGMFAVAEEHCASVLAANPRHPKALYRMGMALMGQDRLEEAEAVLLEARELMGSTDPQIVTALLQVEMSKVWVYYGIGQDGSFVIEDECYAALRESAPSEDKQLLDVFADLADLITALHTGQLQVNKDGEQPPEILEIESAVDAAVGEDAVHLIHWPHYRALAGIAAAQAWGTASGDARAGQGCMQYVLELLELTGGVEQGLLKDASYIVPPGGKWPKNNGFIRIMPLLGYHRVLYPAAADVVIYTTGYVVEKDKHGFTRGQACHAGALSLSLFLLHFLSLGSTRSEACHAGAPVLSLIKALSRLS
jgi:tetratricopeptide (TPR) repeat protein